MEDKQRQISSGRPDSLFSSSILETISKNNNIHQPTELLAELGNLNKGLFVF